MTNGTLITIYMALMLISGYLMTRITKMLKLPNVTAYILAGIILGRYCLKLIPDEFITSTDFLPDIALAFIAFSVGEFFEFDALKKNGFKVIIITLFESLMASLLIFVVTYFIMRLEISFSIMLSALASATAPASTLMTIRQTKAKGDFVDTLLQVVALDDVVGLVAYSIAISIAMAHIAPQEGSEMAVILIPVIKNIGALIIGCIFGLVLKFSMTHKHSTDNRLIIAISILFAFCAICSYLEISPLLGCMAIGMVYINATKDDRLFKQLNYFSPPLLLLFFVRSGASFRLSDLISDGNFIAGHSLMSVSIVYFFIRIVGKYSGAFLGCLITGKPAKTRNHLGLGLIPQAGVAIGLAAMCARILGPGIGTDMQTVIMFSSVLYELIGPACGKLSLYLSGSYSNKLENITQVSDTTQTGETKSAIELLIERIDIIQKEIAEEKQTQSEEETAYNQAIDEMSAEEYFPPKRHGLIRKNH